MATPIDQAMLPSIRFSLLNGTSKDGSDADLLPYISPASRLLSPLYLPRYVPYTSPISPLYLAHISAISPQARARTVATPTYASTCRPTSKAGSPTPTSQARCSLYLPISPYISLYLPYTPLSPYISQGKVLSKMAHIALLYLPYISPIPPLSPYIS